jgi:Peptidase family M23
VTHALIRQPGFALLLGLALGTAASLGATALAEPVLSPLVAMPVAAPNPVLGADGKIHLAYEVTLVNQSQLLVSIEAIDVVDAANEQVLQHLDWKDVDAKLRLNSRDEGNVMTPANSGYLFMDVTLAANAKVPPVIAHRFQLSVKQMKPETDGPKPPSELSFTGAPVSVGASAVVIAPPLKGKRWAVGGGCCAAISYHRGATLAINGMVHVAERFAIDFVQLGDNDSLAAGPANQVTSYPYYGTEVLAVGDGTVAGLHDGDPAEVPGKLPEGKSINNAGGNYIVVDIGEGRFAFYAHLQAGSLKVKEGDKVTQGQVLGLLGNSGNTDTPHLHFHVMDGTSPLEANGLPYAFTAFDGEGVITQEAPLFTNGVVTIDKNALAGPHKDELPLNLEVVNFP